MCSTLYDALGSGKERGGGAAFEVFINMKLND